MAFQSNYVCGRQLTADELFILDLIDNHPYPALLKYGSLGAIHGIVPVEIHDKCSRDYYVEYSIEELKKELEETIASFKNVQDNDNSSVRGELLDDLGLRRVFFERLLNQHKKNSGTIKEKVTNDLLGLYDGQKKVVKIFTEKESNVANIAMTYVHEMMHAYFDTNTAIDKIEEPIVEYCTLMFLEDFVSKNTSYDYILKNAIFSVKQEKNALGVAHYGFGHYLYDYQKKNAKEAIDWMSLYKTANNNIGPSNELTEYKEYFKGLYPFSNELECQDLLYRILMHANGAKRVRSPFNIGAKKLGCTNCPIPASRLSSISWKSFFDVPSWWYDKASKTFCLNGNFELPREVVMYYRDKIVEVIVNLFHKNQINNLYLGPQFLVKDNFIKLLIRALRSKNLKIYVANANKYYCSSNGMLLTKDEKTLLFTSASIVEIPQTVEAIVDGALRSATEIKLHEKFSKIEDINPKLRHLIKVSQKNQALKIDDGMLLSKDGKILYSCPKDVTDVVEVPEGVEVIEDSAFANCRSLQGVTLPNSIKTIEHHAFLHCENLASITLPDSLETIGYAAFSYCKSIRSIEIPSKVVEIKGQTFRACIALTDVFLPIGINEAENAFLYINPTKHHY